MNTFKRKALFTALLAALAAELTGCGLNPKQLQALDGAMCTRTAGYGVSNTTTIVAGASKTGATQIDGDTCSITTFNPPRDGPPKDAPASPSKDAKL